MCSMPLAIEITIEIIIEITIEITIESTPYRECPALGLEIFFCGAWHAVVVNGRSRHPALAQSLCLHNRRLELQLLNLLLRPEECGVSGLRRQ